MKIPNLNYNQNETLRVLVRLEIDKHLNFKPVTLPYTKYRLKELAEIYATLRGYISHNNPKLAVKGFYYKQLKLFQE